MSKYIVVSGFGLSQANRGNSALCYGTFGFLKEKGFLNEKHELIHFLFYRNPFKREHHLVVESEYDIQGLKVKRTVVPVFCIEEYLCKYFGIIFPFTRFGKLIKQVEFEAADYGGDGFSDIYGDVLFEHRLTHTMVLLNAGIPVIVLPQTIGPFKKRRNLNTALKILRKAKSVYVRDDKFSLELKKYGITYERTKDLSAFMKPEPWNFNPVENAIGLNVSGLTYFNKFMGLENQFDCYPELIETIISNFNQKGYVVYLIPHSYNVSSPELNNDDMLACKEVYNRMHLTNKMVSFVDADLTAPQVKYAISKMKFFIGTRMHANFAAIYTDVPLFGLAYSYKFAGAFNANGLDGETQTAMINNIKKEDIPFILKKIERVFLSSVINK